jgi:predicted amidohydrolase
MPKPVIVAACQLPEIREDLDNALSSIETYADRAANDGAELVCFPECFLQGYLVDDELARRHAIDLASPAFEAVLARLGKAKPMLVFGLIEIDSRRLYNTAVVIEAGKLIGRYRKTHLLPGEGIFSPGISYPTFQKGELVFGINICSDAQSSEPAADLARQGATLVLCLANNMMTRATAEKWKDRHNEIRSQRAKETGLWLISSDVTGESDDRLAIGPTSVIDPDGQIVAQVPLLETGIVIGPVGPSPHFQLLSEPTAPSTSSAAFHSPAAFQRTSLVRSSHAFMRSAR